MSIDVLLPAALAFIMFSVGLALRAEDFRHVFQAPRALLIGLCGQLVLVPLAALAVVFVFDLPPALGIGLMILAACPGGASSGFLTHVARGNAALSLTLTVISSLAALATFPLLVKLVLAWLGEGVFGAGVSADGGADGGAGVILRHMRGGPKTMQIEPKYGNVVKEVAGYLRDRIRQLKEQGVLTDAIAVDPGIGFGKTVEHNVSLLAHLDELAGLGRPVVVGLSRKSFIGKITGREVQDRLPGSLAAMAYAIRRGAHVIRVHDVKESCDVARLVDILRREESSDVDV